MARLLLIGIWSEADDRGVFEWKPATLKMRLTAQRISPVSATGAHQQMAVCCRFFSDCLLMREWRPSSRPSFGERRNVPPPYSPEKRIGIVHISETLGRMQHQSYG
jgi:hypothetical protein